MIRTYNFVVRIMLIFLLHQVNGDLAFAYNYYQQFRHEHSREQAFYFLIIHCRPSSLDIANAIFFTNVTLTTH